MTAAHWVEFGVVLPPKNQSRTSFRCSSGEHPPAGQHPTIQKAGELTDYQTSCQLFFHLLTRRPLTSALQQQDNTFQQAVGRAG